MPTDGAYLDKINIISRVGIEIEIFQQLIFTVYLDELTMNDTMIITDAMEYRWNFIAKMKPKRTGDQNYDVTI